MGTFLGDCSFFVPYRDLEGWWEMKLIYRFILKKFMGVNQNPEGDPSISRDMLGCSESACFLPLYGICKLLKFILERSVITKLLGRLKTLMHKNYCMGESYQGDSPSELKIIFGNHKNSGT